MGKCRFRYYNMAMKKEIKGKHRGYIISTDKRKLELEKIQDFLANSSYWAKGRPLNVVRKSVEHSLCFGIYKGNKQAGFARVVSDYATFAWIADLFILDENRGQGLGKWLIETIVTYPELQGINLVLLATQDAHELYRNYGGFEELAIPKKWMSRAT